MKVLSLFDGISVGLQALKELGITPEVYYASEIDKEAILVSKTNHKDIIHIGDVNNIDFNDYKDIDLILAGSPCQGFSTQGKGLGLKDERSVLFYKFVEALRCIKPKYFLLENVKMKAVWKDIIDKEVGVEGIFLSSKYFSTQDRKRWYWTNIPVDLENLPNQSECRFMDIIDENADDFLSNENIENINKGNWVTSKKYLKNTDRYMTDKYPTIWGGSHCCGNTPLVKIDGRYRLLSLLELERLQTLPDCYTSAISNKNRRYRSISNSWNVATIKYILKSIKL